MSRIKSASKRAGEGILTAISTAIVDSHNDPRKERIEAIDKAIELLQEERERLVDELIDTD
jgi:hypothetical protein